MMTDEETKAIAKHFEQPLTECWATAFEDYSNNYPTTRHIHSPRSRASLLHDHCVHHIQLLCSNNPFVNFPPKKRGLFTVELSGDPVGVDGKILARFKKLNERLLTSNIPTKQVKAFNDQRSMASWTQLDLFGFPLIEAEPPHVNIGYLPDAFWMSLEAVYATMPNGSHALHWYVKLDGDAGSDQVPIIDMPILPAAPQVNRRVKPRDVAAEAKRKKGGSQ